VVIPCHGEGGLVVEAVHSIEEDEPVEIVVVDNASSPSHSVAAAAAEARSLGQETGRQAATMAVPWGCSRAAKGDGL
jgi:hypothetical protein